MPEKFTRISQIKRIFFFFLIFFAIFISVNIFKISKIQAFTCEVKPFAETECEHKNLFPLYGTKQIRTMNKNFGKDLTKVYKDEKAHSESEIRFLIQSLRDYDTCFSRLCREVTACDKTTNLHFENQINQCFRKQSQFKILQRAKIEYVLSHNIGRKFRELYETKVRGLNKNFQPHIHKPLGGINGALTSAIQKVINLIWKPQK